MVQRLHRFVTEIVRRRGENQPPEAGSNVKMNRTRYFRTFHMILSCMYILCLSRTSYAGSVIKENGDLDTPQVEDDLNSQGSEHPVGKIGYMKSQDSESSTKELSDKLAEKKASFNAWGGKRNGEIYEEKRPKFATWGGKRDRNPAQSYEDFKRASYVAAKQMAKKPSFSSWGGKRTDGQSKRPSFNSWGGKRADGQSKRPSFNSWGGKRSDKLVNYKDNEKQGGEQLREGMDEEKRARFLSWGGKRYPTELHDEQDTKYKRPQFNAWGGKRAESELSQDELEKRPQFNAWGGKRSHLDEYDEKRTRFNSWGGKRSHMDDSDFDEIKRKFSSWGGKRGGNLETSIGKIYFIFNSHVFY